MRVLAAAALLLASGCALVGEETPTLTLEWVAVVAEVGANRNNATAVDLVLVHDGALEAQVAGLTAADWFRRKDQFRRDFPDGFNVVGWEAVPELSIPPRALDDAALENDAGAAPRAAFVFADYFTPGDHRARLESQEAVRIRLGPDDFTLESFDPPN